MVNAFFIITQFFRMSYLSKFYFVLNHCLTIFLLRSWIELLRILKTFKVVHYNSVTVEQVLRNAGIICSAYMFIACLTIILLFNHSNWQLITYFYLVTLRTFSRHNSYKRTTKWLHSTQLCISSNNIFDFILKKEN